MSLSIQDLTIIEQIIKACQSRGAFDVKEMIPVGQIYAKISNIIQEESKKSQSSSVTEAQQSASSASSKPAKSSSPLFYVPEEDVEEEVEKD